MVGPAGPPATINREPGQARKGAAAAVTLCAGVWLVGFTSMTSIYIPSFITALVPSAPAHARVCRLRPSGHRACILMPPHGTRGRSMGFFEKEHWFVGQSELGHLLRRRR